VRKPIFTISGLRGVFGEDLKPELVMNYAGYFGRFLGGRNIAIGRDTRASGPILLHAAVSGLLSTGYKVYNFGICPTPAIVMMVKKLRLDGGIQITASHNPEEWNGLKLVSGNGRFLFSEELQALKKYIRSPKRKYHFKLVPRLLHKEIIEPYLLTIISSKYFKKIRNKNFRVGIDSCNGAAEESATRLVTMLDATPITIQKASIGFPRRPEPKGENLKRLCAEVKRHKLDFGIAFDPDGDRFSCVDELGVPLSEEATVIFAIQFILEQTKGPVVVNNSTTMAVDEICQKYSVPLYRSGTGEANVVKKMQEVGAIVGGEGNGGVIVPEINLTRDGLVATAILIKLLSKKNRPLSVIRKEIPEFFMEKTVTNNYKDDWQKIIKKKFSNKPTYKFDKLDGLKIIGNDFWILIRKSNTEPILRIIVESKNKSLTDKLIKDIMKEITLKS